jgi:hypothetical protein
MVQFKEEIRSIVMKGKQEALPSPPRSLDHSGHVVATALAGYPELAADHLLSREMKAKLDAILGDIIRQLGLEFQGSCKEGVVIDEAKAKVRQMAYEVIIEIALNLHGIEATLAGFSVEEVGRALKRISYTLSAWEGLEAKDGTTIAQAVVEKYLKEMRKVFAGGSMVAKMGDEIERKLQGDYAPSKFVPAAGPVLRDNVYYKSVERGLCKFGNDYAIGLRWLRHLGFVQVSTNPVLAARAYDDDPALWGAFTDETKEHHSKWMSDLNGFGDEIAMRATMVALLPNLAIFRPIAALTDYHDGMVSYQLNPNVAASVEGSVADALKIYSAAQDFLRKYDEYLLWGYANAQERGRPNIVFKIAGGYPAAVDITSSLNSIGIGTNNTVTYTVAQETALIISAMKGMSEALKRGILPTQIYETNMGGRLESHLREVEVERLLKEALGNLGERRNALLLELAKGLGSSRELEAPVDFGDRVRRVCSFRYLKSLVNDPLIDTLAAAKGTSKEDIRASLTKLENDIALAGTLVCQRVYGIFFSAENKLKWLAYLRSLGLTRDEAELLIDRIDLLPASKRKPSDTYLTFASKNMTNTEFPDHQNRVLEASRQEGFKLASFKNAISRDHDPAAIQRLLLLEDFKRAYELTPELTELIRDVGIRGEFGTGGLVVSGWPAFGSVVKTMTEFTNAYNGFKAKCLESVRVTSQKK